MLQQDKRKTPGEQVHRDTSPLAVSGYQTAPAVASELIRAGGIGTDTAPIDVGILAPWIGALQRPEDACRRPANVTAVRVRRQACF